MGLSKRFKIRKQQKMRRRVKRAKEAKKNPPIEAKQPA